MKNKTAFDILVEEVINNPSDWNNKVKLKEYKIGKKDSKQQNSLLLRLFVVSDYCFNMLMS